MRIHHPPVNPAQNPALEQAANVGPGRVSNSSTSIVGTGANPVSGDQAKLGASSVALTASALGQPEVRSDLVAHFRAQIASGAYTVDPSQVADSMLQDPLTGLGNRERG
ncbi:MAG TPA: flagellar biosynthesis anti-sigma factor FlgM [Terriglobales bacterium]|nr:flagellar biosynthesis anti-sigma factor FlgM [Terriglobales bacterium]